MKLVYYPHESLRKKSFKVENIEAEKALVQALLKVMKQYKGLGLAAPQLGVNKRLFIIDQKDKEPLICFNPEIILTSSEKVNEEEGCLSLPGIRAFVERFKEIEVRFQDKKGTVQEKTLKGLDAICFQHEIDHLNGILYFDHLKVNDKIALLQEYQHP